MLAGSFPTASPGSRSLVEILTMVTHTITAQMASYVDTADSAGR